MKNTRRLLDTLRPDMLDVAKWVGLSIWTMRAWHAGTYTPTAAKNAKLVKATRQHCKELLALAQKMEREGKVQGGK